MNWPTSFAGGVTNWLAVKMLFDKIPFVYGSGVIPNQFVAIRLAVKNMIMRMFFEREFVAKYMKDRAEHFMGNLGGWWVHGTLLGGGVGGRRHGRRRGRAHLTPAPTHCRPAPRRGAVVMLCCPARRRCARAAFSPLRAGFRWEHAAPDSQHQHPLSVTHAQASSGRLMMRNTVCRTPPPF